MEVAQKKQVDEYVTTIFFFDFLLSFWGLLYLYTYILICIYIYIHIILYVPSGNLT